jgi:hypothetical protein
VTELALLLYLVEAGVYRSLGWDEAEGRALRLYERGILWSIPPYAAQW